MLLRASSSTIMSLDVGSLDIDVGGRMGQKPSCSAPASRKARIPEEALLEQSRSGQCEFSMKPSHTAY